MKEQRKGKGGAARTTRDRWSENRGHWPIEFQRAAKKCLHDSDCFRYANPGDAMANTHPDHSKWIIGIKDRPCINDADTFERFERNGNLAVPILS